MHYYVRRICRFASCGYRQRRLIDTNQRNERKIKKKINNKINLLFYWVSSTDTQVFDVYFLPLQFEFELAKDDKLQFQMTQCKNSWFLSRKNRQSFDKGSHQMDSEVMFKVKLWYFFWCSLLFWFGIYFFLYFSTDSSLLAIAHRAHWPIWSGCDNCCCSYNKI